MSRFDETVQKIASSPWKRQMFKRLPALLEKEAGIADWIGAAGNHASSAAKKVSPVVERLFGGADKATGGQEILRDITKNVGTAAALGLGTYGATRLMGDLDDSSEKSKARYNTLGKLEGEQRFRNQALRRLSPLHEQTYSSVLQDPVIGKADPAMMRSAFNTMQRFAPHLATDPNATRAFLQESALYGKGPSYATLKTLADAEGAAMKTYYPGEF